MPDYVNWLRSRIGTRRVFLAYATAVVTDPEGRILCHRRRDFKKWGLPGGVLEIGEELEECARRETYEETGVEAHVDHLIGVYSSPDYAFEYPNGDKVQQFSVCYACSAEAGPTAGETAESEEVAFFEPDRIPPLFPWYRDMVEDFLSGRRHVFDRGSRGAPVEEKPGYLALRPLIGHETLVVPAAAALIRDERGAVLLLRRTDNGEWTLPGGAMELGERVDETMVREVREEVGLEVAPERLITVKAGPYLRFTFPNGDRVQAVTAFFSCRVRSGRPRPDGVEASEVRFFLPSDLPERPEWLTLLRRYLESGD